MKHILLITMLTIKILFTINSLFKKINYFVKTLFTIPSVKKKPLVLIRKKFISLNKN